MRFIDFFAGIGGFRKGLEDAGHKCIGFCEFDKFAVASYTSMHLITDSQREELKKMTLRKRQKEILKEEYRNGEWYADDIRRVDAGSLPKAECWTFGAPCQDFSISGKRQGLKGDRSSLVREIFRLLEEQEEQNRPEWLIYENVKGMLSSNKGLDYLSILSEMDRLGYDIEWQNINSKWFVPQNRERIYTIGHLRRYGRKKVFPIQGTDGKNSVSLIGHRNGYRKNMQTFLPSGITESLDTGQGGGRGYHVGLSFIDLNIGAGIKLTDNARIIQSRYDKGVCNRSGEVSEVAIMLGEINSAQNRHDVGIKAIGGIYTETSKKFQNGVYLDYCRTLKGQKHDAGVAFEIVNIAKNKEERMFINLSEKFTVYAIWYEKYQCYIVVRKLTPKECFRLQGWTDEYFEKAAFVNSDNQLYKQAGNGVTIQCVEALGIKIKNLERKQEGE